MLHPLGRRQDELHPQLVPRRGRHLQGRLGCRCEPVEDPFQLRTAQRRRHGQRSGQLHARRRCLGWHHQERRQDSSCGEDGHPQRRSPRCRRVRVVQGERRAQGSRVARCRLRHGPRRVRLVQHPVPERQQLGAYHRRFHGSRRQRHRLGFQGSHRWHPGAHRAGPRPVAPDRHRFVGVRRPRPAVRHHHQQVAHRARHGPHQRFQPVQRVHAPRQLGVQPRLHQLAQVPRPRLGGRRQLRHRGLHAHHRGHLHGAGDPRRPSRLPHRAHRRYQPQVPPTRYRLCQPRCAAHGARPAVRLGGGSCLGRSPHLTHDRPCLRHQRSHRQPHGALRRVRRERELHAQRAAHAPRRLV